MNKSLIGALLTLASLFLTACGSGNIDLVKQQKLRTDNSYTVGQAYDNRPVCQDISWREYKDEKERIIVEYQCEMAGAEEYSRNLLSSELSKIEQEKKIQIENTTNIVNQLKNVVPVIDKALMEIKGERELFSTSERYKDIQFFMKTISSGDKFLKDKSADRFLWCEPCVERKQCNPSHGTYGFTYTCPFQEMLGVLDNYILDRSEIALRLATELEVNEQTLSAIELNAAAEVAKLESEPIHSFSRAIEIQKWAVVNGKDISFVGAYLQFQSNNNQEFSSQIYDLINLERSILGDDAKDFATYLEYFIENPF